MLKRCEIPYKSQSKDEGSVHAGKFIDTIEPQPIFSPANSSKSFTHGE